MRDIKIIENTPEAKDDHHREWYGGIDVELKREHLQALLDGKALAWDDGEYSTTLILMR